MNKMHMMAVEVSDIYGRWWESMYENEVDEFISDLTSQGKSISDVDHSTECWCRA